MFTGISLRGAELDVLSSEPQESRVFSWSLGHGHEWTQKLLRREDAQWAIIVFGIQH